MTDELPDGHMVDQWEPLSSNSVKTPLEVLLEFVYYGCLRLLCQFVSMDFQSLFFAVGV